MGGCAGTSQNSVCAYVQTNFITGPAETLASPLLRLRPKRTQPHGATPLCTRTCFPRTVTASSPSSRCAQHSVLVYSRTVHDSASSPSSRCTRHSVSVYSRTAHDVNVSVSYSVLVYSRTVHDSASSPSSRCTRHSVSVYSRTVHDVNVSVSYSVLVYSRTVHDSASSQIGRAHV